MRLSTAELDPLPLTDNSLGKSHHHLLRDGQRVKIVRGEHAGKTGRLIANTGATYGGCTVKLDNGGHMVSYDHDDLEPLGFDGASAGDYQRAFGGGFAEGLLKAISDGTISDADLALAKTEIRKYQEGSGAVDPLPGIDATYEVWHDPRLAALEMLCRKYAGGAPRSDTLAKRARPGLRVGLKVRDRHTGAIGVIESMEGALVKVRTRDGETHVLESAAMECLEPVE